MKKLVFAAFGLVFVATACTTPGTNTAIGAGAGAAVGAVAGGVIANNTKGGETWKGAVIGGVAGALVGGAVGNYFDAQAKELAAIATVEKIKDAQGNTAGLKITLKNDILFDVGSAELSSAAQKTLTDLLKVLNKYPKNQIVVEGNTDNTGSAAFNQTLSEQRAKAVYNFLLGTGLKTKRISYIGYGMNNPIADNSTPEGRAANRRVNLNITVDQADL